MKTKIFLIALFASCQIFAQNDKSFLNYVNFNPDSINFEKSDNVGKFINIDIQQIQKSNVINFDLPNGRDCNVNNFTKYTTENNYHAWAGKILNKYNKIEGFAYFVEKKKKVYGKVYTLSNSYMITPVNDTIHQIKQIKHNAIEGNDCLNSFFNNQFGTDFKVKQDSIFIKEFNNISKYDFPLPNESHRTLRMAFLYTPQALNFFLLNSWEHSPSSIIDLLNFYVEELNFVFAFSQIDLKAVFAYASLTDSEVPGWDMYDELYAFWDSNDGHYDEIFEIDPTLNADVSVLILSRSNDTAVGGIGSPYWVTNHDKFIVKISNLKGMTLPHELGHVMGCNHNIEEVSVWERAWMNPMNSYGYANVNGGYRSIMSYSIDGHRTIKMPFYSNPTQDFANGMRGAYGYDYTWNVDFQTNCRGAVQGNSGNLIIRRADYDENAISRTINGATYSNHYDIDKIEAENYICENESQVLMHARNKVVLKPGFHAKADSKFHAYISDYDCSPSVPTPVFTPQQPEVIYLKGGLTTVDPIKLCPCEFSNWLYKQSLYFAIDEFDGIAVNYAWELSKDNIGLLTWNGWNDDSFVCGISRNFSEDWVPGIVALNVYGINSIGEKGLPVRRYLKLLPADNQLCIDYCNDKKERENVNKIQFSHYYNNTITIYPNPANNELNVKLNFAEMQNSTELIIYDIFGKKLVSKSLQNTQNSIEKFNIRELHNGMYFIKINSGNLQETRKFLIQK